MNYDLSLILPAIYSGGSFLLLYLFVFALSNLVYEKTAGYSVKNEISKNDNAAVAVSLAGYLIAITIIFVGCVLGPSKTLVADLMAVAKYCAVGIFLLYISHLVNDKVILYQFKNRKELIEDKNVGTGAVQAGSYIASGLIVAGSVHGQGGGLDTALTFFVLGQFCLILFAKIYNLITPFNVHDEIEKDNFSAGVAFSGTLVALGIILSKSAAGDFISWEVNLLKFGGDALIAFILLPVFRVVIDKLVVRGEDLNEEISQDQNLGAGFLEFGATVSFASVLFFVL